MIHLLGLAEPSLIASILPFIFIISASEHPIMPILCIEGVRSEVALLRGVDLSLRRE